MNKIDYFKEDVNKIFKLYFNHNFELELIHRNKYYCRYSFNEKSSDMSFFIITFSPYSDIIELDDNLITSDTKQTNFENIYTYFKNWYKYFSLFEYKYIIELPNFNNDEYNKVIE